MTDSYAGPLMSPTFPAVFVSADWAKSPTKRSVHVADLAERRVEARHGTWTFRELLELARGLSDRGPVLVGIDVALGVPAGVLARARQVEPDIVDFLGYLGRIGRRPGFFETVREARGWGVEHPFFAVPAGTGGRTSFEERVPGGLRREIDRSTGANPLFAVSGIPGSVGSGTRELWRELAPLLEGRDFAVWPFDGALESLLSDRGVVVAETYPGMAYGAAVADRLPARRVRLAKTQADVRRDFCDAMQKAAWVGDHQVDLGDLGEARADEDAFDSLVTAAALLRCAVENVAVVDPAFVDAGAEGGMLLAGPVRVREKSVRWTTRSPAAPLETARPRAKRTRTSPTRSSSRTYPCPIPGCSKIFSGGRGGWDAHAGSLRMHPQWHPDVRDAELRRALFRREFEDWFVD